MSVVESSKTLDIFLNNAYKHEHFQNFIIESFGKDIDIKTEQRTPYDKHNSIITAYSQMCENITLDSQSLSIYAFKTTSINAKITLHKEIAEIIKNQPEINVMLAVFYDESKEFRLSLVTQGFDYEKNKTTFSNLRRQSFTLGENTKTKTAKLQLQGFLDKEKTLKNLQEAFSTEPISKEFYRDYERLYKDLSQKLCQNQATFNALDNYEGLNGEKAVNAFVKKLLGRIVFLYFLQKKGWLGVAQNASYGEGDKNFLFSLFSKATQNNESFYTKYLCPLFFETLNSKRKDPQFGEDYSPHFDCKIPFLNGGLFEEYKDKQGKGIERDFILAQSLENTDFKAIFDVFENYNFTIEESTPDNQEIGIDPEMLGKVFENLIDYNKSSGAFYTPREIVHFMCKNVLTRTLQERILHDESHLTQDTESPHAHKDSLYNFIFYKQSDDFIAQNAKQLTQAITSLKILDPAIGSGAFPMGMLSEILEALHTLNPSLQKQDLARYKREIIEQQIYGIDIDADAIEIAKLRFWLSIAVDEDTPSPLPNLDFKFMQGNALIESINGIEIIPSDLNAPQHQKNLLGRDENASLFDKSQTNKLEALFLQYYEPNAQKAQLKAEILAIMKEAFDERIKQIDENIQSIKANPAIKPKERVKQQEKILQYKSFKHDLDTLFKDYKEHNFHTDKLFLYHFFFAPVFQNGGFDIVIGNPPYIKEADNKKLFDGTRHLRTYQGKMDIWYHFVGLGFDIVKNKGIVTFIATNNWTTNTGAKNLRNVILRESQILNLIDFGSYMCFDSASIQTMIMEFQKVDSIPKSYQINYAKIDSKNPTDKHRDTILAREEFEDNILLKPSITPSQMLDKPLTFVDSKQEEVLNKILENGTFYLQYDEVWQGLVHPQPYLDKKMINLLEKESKFNYKVGNGVFNLNKEEIELLSLNTAEKRILKPYYETNNLLKYYGIKETNIYVIYTDSKFNKVNSMDKYPNLKKHLDNLQSVITSCNKPYGLHRSRKQAIFEGEKILSRVKCVDFPVFTYVNFPCYVGLNFNIIKTERINLKYLVGILNSKPIAFWLKHKGKMQGNNYQINQEPLMNIPIPKITKYNKPLCDKIITLVEEILAIKAKDSHYNTSHLESHIDKLVYELYNLSEALVEKIEMI